MKHTLKITIVLVLLFIAAQLVGLATITNYIQVDKQLTETGEEKITINYPDTALGEQPDIDKEDNTEMTATVTVIFFALIIGTVLLLLLIRFNLGKLWKIWFFMAIFMALSVSFKVYTNIIAAFILGALLAAWRIFKPNPWVHNVTEVFIYTGIAILILPLINVTGAIVMLIIISFYDMYAVWKSKHMVKMAKFMTNKKLFAGLFVEYKQPKGKSSKKAAGKTVKSAILGGGDIAFPLLFSVTVLESRIITKGLTKSVALSQTLIVTLFVTLSLLLLFLLSKKDRFYPAMPFLTAGCLVGYAVLMLF
ncbi:MAG: hypothetical protein KJ601_01390 [Nanoarchaeota archaeon]|nr:hypothetical protein [Nanoarchaeota archaeon]MBU1703800.1 hypothetical protein [Nanoarchaeota archaeon]